MNARIIVRSALLLVVCANIGHRACGQDLIDMYRTGRVRAISTSIEDIRLEPRSPDRLGKPVTELEHWFKAPDLTVEVIPQPSIEINRFQKVPKLGRKWFRDKFPDLRWSYEGSYRLTQLDTMRTTELRARMEAQFGSPTQTLPDLGLLRKLDLPEYVQFEYWFVLNDSIPLVVIDVNGPFERGLVVATDEQFRAILTDIRDAFLGQVVADPIRERFADYYYEEELGQWFLTGFDGTNYFLRSIDPRTVSPGRPIPPSF